MALALVAGALASILVALSVAILAHASAATVPSLAPKSATAAVSMEISRLIGGLPPVTATLTLMTGIIGAVGGPYVSQCFAHPHAGGARLRHGRSESRHRHRASFQRRRGRR